MFLRPATLVCLLAAVAACDGQPTRSVPPAPSTLVAASPDAAAPGDAAHLRRIRRAELSRKLADLDEADLAHRSPAVRRAAVRAYARIGSPAAREALLRALADEDAEVVAWAAFGVGQVCAGQREPVVRALVATAVRVAATDLLGVDDAGSPTLGLSPWWAIARAVGRCGGSQAEPTLLAWARAEPMQARAALLGLGDLAAHQNRLREETFVALLKLAAGDAARAALPEALYPFGRVAHLPPSVIERTRQVAKAALDRKGPARIFALHALARTDDEAVPVLADVVRQADGFSAAERAEAVRGLKQLGSDGQRALRELLGDLMPASGPVAVTSLIGDHFNVLLAVVSSLASVGSASARLRRLAQLPVAAELPRPIRRRVSLLRCAAAQLLVERHYDDPLLVGCDVTEPSTDEPPAIPKLSPLAARAVVQALGIAGAKIRGARRAAWLAFTQAEDPRVRAAAIALLVDHHEIDQSAQVLAEALRSESPGVVAAAARVITKVPARAAAGQGKGDKAKVTGPHPDVVAALLERLKGQGPTADVEALAAVIDAAGALVLQQALPSLRVHCQSPRVTLRDRAQVALAAVADRSKPIVCEPPAEGLTLPAEFSSLEQEPVKVVLQTDAGELVLRLDPTYAPVAVTRFARLVREGFFDGTEVHRVVAGFVTQFGSPSADGFGPEDQTALPCELSPLPFEPATVGVALAGRDTGSTQLFVTHATVPRLDGEYSWLGTASGPWGAVAPGDVIRKATLGE